MKTRLRLVGACLAVLLSVSAPARAEEPAAPPKMADIPEDQRADILKLLKVMQPDGTFNQKIDQILGMLKRRAPKVPERYWEAYKARISVTELRDMAIPFYAQYYTPEDIRQLTVFLQSPTGQKFLVSEPKILQATFMAGLDWGRRMGEQIKKELKAEGYEVTM